MEFKNANKRKDAQTALPSKYPQGHFKDKQCRMCATLFSPMAPSEHYCSDECKDRAIHDRYLRRSYGITITQYEALYTSQEGKCAICATDGTVRASANGSVPLVLNHCHTTGTVRGLLCHTCNSALGQFNDSIEMLNKARKYLKYNANIAPTEFKVGQRKTDLSDNKVLEILQDSRTSNLTKGALASKYNITLAKVKGIVTIRTVQAKRALERLLIIEGATTVPNGSTSQVNGGGSSGPQTGNAVGDGIV